jgi:hypothetical protein
MLCKHRSGADAQGIIGWLSFLGYHFMVKTYGVFEL